MRPCLGSTQFGTGEAPSIIRDERSIFLNLPERPQAMSPVFQNERRIRAHIDTIAHEDAGRSLHAAKSMPLIIHIRLQTSKAEALAPFMSRSTYRTLGPVLAAQSKENMRADMTAWYQQD